MIEENINQTHSKLKGNKYQTNNSSEFSDQLSDQLINKKDIESNQSETFASSQQPKNKSKKYWIILIIILALVGIGLGIYFGLS